VKLQKLLSFTEQAFGPGIIFRCNRAEYPYESMVDFIIRHESESPSGFAMMAISGSQAGKTFQFLPKESLLPSDSSPFLGGVSVDWIKKNWEKWIYPECPVQEVEIYKIHFQS
jgi:hypothetical protein